MENNLLSEQLIYTGESETQTHLHLYTYNAESVDENSATNFKNIIPLLDSSKINWLQIHGMKNTDTIRDICSHFEIDFLVLQDILNANHPTKIEIHDTYLVLILKLFNPIPREEVIVLFALD